MNVGLLNVHLYISLAPDYRLSANHYTIAAKSQLISKTLNVHNLNVRYEQVSGIHPVISQNDD